MGSRGDSYDSAFAESVIALYKGDLIFNRGPGPLPRTLSSPRSPGFTGGTTRLHSTIGNVPPAESEVAHYARQRVAVHPAFTKSSLYRSRSGPIRRFQFTGHSGTLTVAKHVTPPGSRFGFPAALRRSDVRDITHATVPAAATPAAAAQMPRRHDRAT